MAKPKDNTIAGKPATVAEDAMAQIRKQTDDIGQRTTGIEHLLGAVIMAIDCGSKDAFDTLDAIDCFVRHALQNAELIHDRNIKIMNLTRGEGGAA